MQEEFPIHNEYFFHCYDSSSSTKRSRDDGHSLESSHVISQEEGDSLEDMLMSSPCTKRARYNKYCPETASAPPSPGVVSLAPVNNTTMPVGEFESFEHRTNHKKIPREWWKHPAPTPPPQHNTTQVSNTARSALESSSSSSASNLICVVCQTTYIPCQVEQEPSVMPANALLNYFSCKKKSSLKAAATRTKTTTSTTNNNNSHCTFCERSACPDCMRNCEECQQSFCSFCSTQEYHGKLSSRTVCLDCCRRDDDPVVRRPQEDNNVDGMDLD